MWLPHASYCMKFERLSTKFLQAVHTTTENRSTRYNHDRIFNNGDFSSFVVTRLISAQHFHPVLFAEIDLLCHNSRSALKVELAICPLDDVWDEWFISMTLSLQNYTYFLFVWFVCSFIRILSRYTCCRSRPKNVVDRGAVWGRNNYIDPTWDDRRPSYSWLNLAM